MVVAERKYSQDEINKNVERLSDIKGYSTDVQRRESGSKNLKRKLLGRFGVSKYFSFNELASKLVEANFADTYVEASEIIPNLENKQFHYTPFTYLIFTKVQSSDGNEKYLVRKWEN